MMMVPRTAKCSSAPGRYGEGRKQRASRNRSFVDGRSDVPVKVTLTKEKISVVIRFFPLAPLVTK